MAEMAECTCRQCGATFLYNANAVLRGRGKFCSRGCGSANGRALRWAKKVTIVERMEKFVIRRGATDCWGWSGFKHKGYGRIRVGKNAVGAHRIRYEAAYGPIPAGLVVMHACDNRECTNPRHLMVGTSTANTRDRDIKGRGARGERAGNAVLTESIVRDMKLLYRGSKLSVSAVAERFGVKRETARSVLTGRTWRHVECCQP